MAKQANSTHRLGGDDPVAIVAGVRTPFARAWTVFKDWTEADLGREAVAELINRVDIDPELVDQLIFGCVSAPMDGPNVAREIVLRSQLPQHIPASTVQMYCASSAAAAVEGINSLLVGTSTVVIAGGVESMSAARARYSLPLTHALREVASARTLQDRIKALGQLKASDLKPETPAIEEPTTGKSMGESAELMAKEYGISREEQDAFAEQTHHRAAAALAEGKMPEVMTLLAGDSFDQVIDTDPMIRPDTTREQMARLRPVFDRRHGTITAANASPLTDGASAVMLMRKSTAERLGLEPLAFVRSYAQVGIDIAKHNLLLGPTFATPIAFQRAGVTLNDMDLVDMHEAFAAQVLANLKIWKSQDLCRSLGLDDAIGDVKPETFNVNGGSIPLGHPFGATGGRMIMQLAGEMHRRDKNLGLLTMCAAGGLGLSMVLER